jgi:hypothetical protein
LQQARINRGLVHAGEAKYFARVFYCSMVREKRGEFR